jgi:thiamine biosynthesis lipoprotein
MRCAFVRIRWIAGALLTAAPAMAVLAAVAAAPAPAVPGEAAGMEISRARYLMGTTCEGTVLLPGGATAADWEAASAALEASFDEIDRLERILSDWKQDSELSRVNREAHASPVACSADLYGFLETAARYGRLTGGAYDLTVAPLMRAYDVRGAGRWPSDEDLAAARSAVGFGRVHMDPVRRTVRFGAPGMALDPGGLGKGYALDAAARVLRERGFHSALLDFGGQVLAMGAPRGERGWRVAIAHPLRRDEPALTLLLKDASVATSANAERGRVVDGRPLGHVIDPGTGRPVSWQGSASALASTGAAADAYSTALMVMGPERGLAWAAGVEGLTAVFLEQDDRGQLVVRPGPGLDTHDAPPFPAGRGAASQGGSR